MSAAGFYTTLLGLRRFWDGALANESAMELSLPEAGGTNGTYLLQQASGRGWLVGWLVGCLVGWLALSSASPRLISGRQLHAEVLFAHICIR